MLSTRQSTPWFWFLLFALIFCAQVVPRTFQESPTDDEPLELTNGYYYWEGDVVTHNHHPPLAKMLQALPLRTLNLNSKLQPDIQDNQLRAFEFFFDLNRNQFESMTLLGRWVTLLFGLGIGFLLFINTRANIITAIAALTLWTFEPTILAYSGLCLDDIPVTFFLFAAVLIFKNHSIKSNAIRNGIAGVLTSMAVGCKFSALALIPIFFLLELWNWKKEVWNKNLILKSLVNWLWALFGFTALIGLLYLPGTLWEFHHSFPWIYFWKGLQHLIQYSDFHHPTYFLGMASRQNHWLYFPLAFTLKTTLPLVALTFACILYGILQRGGVAPWLWITPFIFFLSIMPVQNLGVRYLLPLFPFLIVMSAELLNVLWNWKPSQGAHSGKLLVTGLLLWHIVSVTTAMPNMISYFNELVSQKEKIYYLGDSNLDMGQDIKRVAQTAVVRDWKNIKLAQFGGTMDPSIYGLRWESWTRKDLRGPQPGHVYLVNALLLQLGPIFEPTLLPIAQSWMIHATPTGQIGDTWFYFEVPGLAAKDTSPQLESVHYF
jgi:hypothetical protein